MVAGNARMSIKGFRLEFASNEIEYDSPARIVIGVVAQQYNQAQAISDVLSVDSVPDVDQVL